MAHVPYKTVVRRYYGTLNGRFNTGRKDGVKDIGPCLVEIHEEYFTRYHDSYYVHINERHQCGGFLDHGYDRFKSELHLTRRG